MDAQISVTTSVSELSANATTGSGQPLRRQLGRQSALLFSGFAIAQMCSFARNAIIGYALSKGDFGVAATITIALQMLETLSDLGADRLLVQSADGDDPRLMAAAHATLVVRGLLTAILLYLSAAYVVNFFDITKAQLAFELAALVPLIKSFMHLDSRRQQRALQNRNFVLIEVVPQALSLAATMPILALTGGYLTVVWIAVLQALLSVVTSHALSRRPYAIGLETEFVKRLLAFGWPIWLSAFPLVLVYQGDRVIVGRLLGMDALAGYSAAFMIAMVPGLLAAKIGHALMLPLLSAQRDNPSTFYHRYVMMCEGTSIAAAAYLVTFVLAGGVILPLAFGPQYGGLSAVTGWLAAMWSLRMVQSVPGMALMALCDTRPLLTAGIIRATALGVAWLAIVGGYGLAGVAAAGVLGELASLTYVAVRVGRDQPRLARTTLVRASYPLLAGAAAVAVTTQVPAVATALLLLPIALLMAACSIMAGLALMPSLRGFIDGQSSQVRQTSTRPREDNYAANQS